MSFLRQLEGFAVKLDANSLVGWL